VQAAVSHSLELAGLDLLLAVAVGQTRGSGPHYLSYGESTHPKWDTAPRTGRFDTSISHSGGFARIYPDSHGEEQVGHSFNMSDLLLSFCAFAARRFVGG